MKYLLSLFTGLGNAIQKTPLISAIHAHDAKAIVDIIGDDRFSALRILKDSTLISRVYQTSKKPRPLELLRLYKTINESHYDAVFLLADATPRWVRYLSYLSNADKIYQSIWPYRIKLLDRIELLSISNKVTLCPVVAGRHEIDVALDMLEVHTRKPFKRNRKTWIATEKDLSVISRYKIPNNYICLQVGAANGLRTAKRWSLDNFSNLILALHKKYPTLGIVTVGDRGDNELLIKPLAEKHTTLINTAGLTNLIEVTSIISMSRGLVCHDSGLMHIGNAMGVPLIALYGPTDHYRTAPLGYNSTVIRKDIGCSPCMYNYGTTEAKALELCPKPACMNAITPDEVIDEIERIMFTE